MSRTPPSKSDSSSVPHPVPGWRVRAAAGLLTFGVVLVLPVPALWSSRIALACALASGLHCILTYSVILRPRREEMQAFVRQESSPPWGPLFAFGFLALGSLATLLYLLRSVSGQPPGIKGLHLALSLFGVLAGWVLLHTGFALRYAALYYAPAPGRPECPSGGLSFPDPDLTPDYWDFLYYAFVIGMCYQTSDVSVLRPDIRRTTLLHSVFAYLYGVGLLSMVIGAVSGAL